MSRAENERNRKAAYAKKRRADNSNIGKCPRVKRRKLRKECEHDLELWHREVFKDTTGLKPFGESQKGSIQVSDQLTLNGGKVNKLEPRAFGKTSRGVQEMIHALAYNRRRYGVIFGSSLEKATEIFEGIEYELTENQVLFDTFPELCHPIRALNGSPQGAKSQHIDGTPTNLVWKTGKAMIFGTIPGFKPSGAMLQVRPITNARGLNRRTKQGTIRPDFYLLDDIQKDGDASNPNTVRKLLNIIRKSILRGAGYSRSAAVMNLATIIEPDDVPDTLSRDPSWITVKYRFLESRATHEEMWLGEYAELRRGHDGSFEGQQRAWAAATKFYKRNRKKMEAGATVNWEWAYPWDDPTQHTISAIQHFYNILIDDGEEVAACELQNEPLRIKTSTDIKCTKEELRASVVNIKRGIVPIDSTKFVSFIDVHKKLLYWAAAAIDTEPFDVHFVDYGTWPSQPNRYFHLNTAKRTIPDKFPNLTMKAAVAKALGLLIDELIKRKFRNQEGARVHFDRILVDANWGPTEKQVKKVVRDHTHANLLLACHGKGIPATKTAMSEWKRKPGETKGDEWIKKRQTSKAVNTLLYDTNHWKTELHIGLAADNNSHGTITIFDDDVSNADHALLFDHLLIESERLVTSLREVHQFTNPPDGENHWFDCFTGCLVGGSVESGEKKKSRTSSTQFTI